MSQFPLHLLCVEPRFPGRLGAVADWLVRRRGYRVSFFCHNADPRALWPESTGKGLDVISFGVGGLANEQRIDWTRVLERSLCYSYGCWEVLSARHPRQVDVILGRSAGLGSTLFANVEIPRTPVVQFYDTYFDSKNTSLSASETYLHWRKAANAIELIELENGTIPWTATQYQRGLFPGEYRDDFHVIFDGVETRSLPPRDRTPLTINDKTLDENTRVVTFVARSLDALRGFDTFAQVFDRLAQTDPNVVAIAAGSPIVDHAFDHANYGSDFPAKILASLSQTARERMLLPGVLSQANLARVLARSDLHFYGSQPHPVSRSLAQAMAAGCVVLVVDDAAVREFVEHDATGLLASREVDELTAIAQRVLGKPLEYRTLGDAAATFAREKLSRDVTLPRLVSLFDRLVDERR